MTPVTQTKLVGRDGYGTCWTAALASILGLPEAAVPHFADPARFTTEGEVDLLDYVDGKTLLNYWWAGRVWLRMLGYDLWEVDPALPERHPRRPSDRFLIACGLSPRSPGADGEPIHHAVVYARAEDGSYALAHDPYPDGGGLAGDPTDFYAVRPLEAAP